MNKEAAITHKEDSLSHSELAAVISHDLMSALAGVTSGLDLIDTEALDEESAAQIARVRGSAKMLREMVYIAFGNTEELSNDNIDIPEELFIIEDIWAVQARAKGFNLRLDCQENPPLLQSTDKVSFHRIINNLINNSFKYGNGSDITVRVICESDAQIRIDVTDQGPGFSEKFLTRIFEYGSRNPEDVRSGSGLGLYIVKTLVTSMGGQISAHNAEHGGAVVSMTFPAIERRSNPSRASKGNVLPDLRNLNILLAEDNVTNQLVVTQMLQRLGAQYTIASDGVEALELLKKNTFDMVLLDIEMPRKSGLEVLREVRASSEDYANLPIIALTAYVMLEHRNRIFDAGADGLIAKPIEGIAALGNAILGYLNGRTEMPVVVSGPSHPERDVGMVDSEIFNDLKNVMGPDAVQSLLDNVCADLRRIQTDLIDAEVDNDLSKVRMASHTLVAVAGSVGATNLQACAQTLNSAAKNEDFSKRQSLSMQCIDGINSVLEYISSA